MSRSSKGYRFEREICRCLSLWFSKGKQDDWFWRTSSSGARATKRADKGKETAGQYGDVTATCAEGRPLTDLLTIELKRGYASATISETIDRTENSAVGRLESWIRNLRVNQIQANTPYWMLIHRRDSRSPMVYVPHMFLADVVDRLENRRLFEKSGLFGIGGHGFAWSLFAMYGKPSIRVACAPLPAFLKCIEPRSLNAIATEFHSSKRA